MFKADKFTDYKVGIASVLAHVSVEKVLDQR